MELDEAKTYVLVSDRLKYGLRLDYVFTSKESMLKAISSKAYKTIDVSNHFPLEVDFVWIGEKC